MTKSLVPILALIVSGLVFFQTDIVSPTALSPEKTRQINYGDGLVYEQYKHPSVGEFYVVKLKLDSKLWRLQPAINPIGVTKALPVKELAIRSNPDAMCSINASFFDPGYYPVGTVAIHGRVVSLDNRNRSMIGIIEGKGAIVDLIKPKAFVTPDDYFEPIWLWGCNHPPKNDSIVLYNYHYGSSLIAIPKDGKAIVVEDDEVKHIIEKDSAYIPVDGFTLIFRGKSLKHFDRFKIGSKVKLGLSMPDRWQDVTDIITGGPRLIDNGRAVNLKNHGEGFPSSFFKKHKRSVVGLTWNNEIFVAMFPQSVTYETVSSVLLEINVMDAIGLDGGSSSSMWVKGIRSINGSKKVPVALAIVPRKPDEPPRPAIPFFKDIFKK